MLEFRGVKIALLNGDKIIVSHRDDKPTIPFPGMWDLPGGGREGEESPIECILREVKEELGIELDTKNIVWQRKYPSLDGHNQLSYFMVAYINLELINSIAFGDEGQQWKLMEIEVFLSDDNVIPGLKERLSDFLTRPENIE